MTDEEQLRDDAELNDDARLDEKAAAQEQEPNEERGELEAEARKLGWKPRDDWKGDTSGWVDADEYLDRLSPVKLRETIDRQSAELERLKRERTQEHTKFQARLDRMDKMSQAAMQRQREQLMGQVKAAQRQAAEAGDMEAFDYYQEQEREVAERFAKDEQEFAAPAQTKQQDAPDPTIEQWAKANPAIVYNPAKWQAAIAFFSEAETENPNGTIADHLAHVEDRINQTWPDTVRKRSSSSQANGKQQRNGSGERQPRTPQIEGGARQASGAKRAKGWTDIPGEERSILDRHIKEGLYKDRTDAASTYWR